MALPSVDLRTVASIVALAVVTALAVPVVGAPTITGSATDPGAVVTSSSPSGAPELSVAPSPVPVATGFEPVPSEAPPAPTSPATDDDPGTAPTPEPTPTRSGSTGGVGTGAAAGSSGRPAATAPPKPLFAQPAPVVSPTASGACPSAITGTTPGAPSRTSPLGVAGTTSADLQSFAEKLNEIRVANCLAPVPFANIRYDSCMEDRLFWMAEDPSTDPSSAWGHIGSQRSDGVPSVGCDGNLAGGSNNTGTTVAQKWWDSTGHRTSLYKPTYTGSTAGVCILFAMTHGGVPNEPYAFTRAAARWVTC